MNGLTLGALDTPANFFNGKFYEVICRTGNSSAGTRAQIQGYLKAIYGTA